MMTGHVGAGISLHLRKFMHYCFCMDDVLVEKISSSRDIDLVVKQRHVTDLMCYTGNKCFASISNYTEAFRFDAVVT